jgi:hypothetical protein
MMNLGDANGERVKYSVGNRILEEVDDSSRIRLGAG